MSEIKGVKIYALSNNKNDFVRKSRKVKNFSYYPKAANETEWVSNLNEELKKFEIDVIMPIDEYGILTLIKNKSILLQNSKLVLLPELNTFNTANNKGLLSKHLQSFQIPAPKTILYNTTDDLSTLPLEFPVLMKPFEGGGGGKGIILLKDSLSVKNFFSSNKVEFPFLIQSYIQGYDIDCSVLCKNGKILAFTIQKGILQGDSEFEPNIGLEFLHEKELYIVVKKLVKSLNWSGIAHIDMRYDVNDKTFKVIEINPRFWETTEASEIAGVNFPYLYCLERLDIAFGKPEYRNIKFMDLRGIGKTFRNNKLFLFKIKFLLRNTPIKYYLKDPLPFLNLIRDKIRSLLPG
ncbi:ATP-grasp domain-containing protein [Seonamhaeicola sp.]|uniref:ATP-grasp domain-containing protein n=1 Tax=Seonamhaeicola sp. TaxID=1912245 RepID=UPI002621381F|nr:ATP-grasp domain-containing protein [Seonamhaeicola sp.]